MYISESKIESAFVHAVRSVGGWCSKFTAPGTTGVPDRIVIYKGHVFFVELKVPGKLFRERQKWVAHNMNEHGAKIILLNCLDKIPEFITFLKSHDWAEQPTPGIRYFIGGNSKTLDQYDNVI